MKYKTFVLTRLALIILLTIHASDSQASTGAVIEDLWFTADFFQDGTGQGYTITEDGLTMSQGEFTAVYTSPPINAPIPFNAVVPQWTAALPPTAEFHLLIRTAPADGQWGDWSIMESHADWDLPDDSIFVGEMIGVPAADTTHQFVQFQIGLDRHNSFVQPTLHQLRLTFIDSTDGPTIDEMIAQQIALNEKNPPDTPEASYPKPFVISRAVWCQHAACNQSNLQYHPVTHLIVHHTVSNNATVDWPANVRAIWNYHTFTLGWGDIGYNYLVDPHGNLYEGRRGGDNVVGAHATIANVGSMALSFLGTFESYVPPSPMLNAAAELLAWKADQRNIDVYDASSALPNVPWGLPHLMGHRDVLGGTNTACPGAACHALLPWLRDAIASRLGQPAPHIYVHENSGDFVKSNAHWYVPDGQCGHNTHAYYTWSTTNSGQSTNWGKWYPDIAADGRYQIEAYVPYCITGASETNGARYEIHHANGTATVTVSQNNYVGLWIDLGQFEMRADGSSYIRLSDLTSTDNGRGVWFDAIRLLPVDVTGSTVTNQTPTDGIWLNNQTVNFAWSLSNPENVQQTKLQIATDTNFTNIIQEKTWPEPRTSSAHVFDLPYPTIYWRVQLTTGNGQSVSAKTQFGLDVVAPQTAVHALHYNPLNGEYQVSWQGTDHRSGIAAYDIEVRADNSSTWQPLLMNTTQTTAVYTPPNPHQIYWFRSRAHDHAGNVEAVHSGSGDINTTQATTTFNPTITNLTPGNWVNNLTVNFNWQLADITNIQSATLFVATNPAFSSPLLTKDVTNLSSSQHTFAQEYSQLYWRVSITFMPPGSSQPYTIISDSTIFGIDVTAPQSAVTAVYTLNGDYYPSWSGSDNLSGPSLYNVDYRVEGSSDWVRWLTETAVTLARFTQASPSQTIWFRVQAIDTAGNIEALHTGEGDINTNQANPFPHAIMLPVIYRN